MGVLRSDIVTHSSSLTTAGASVLFDGGDANAGTTGLKTPDSGNKYEIQGDTSELTIECWIYCTNITNTFDTIWATNNYGVSGNSANFYQHYDGIFFTATGFSSDLILTGLFELNKWHHVATTRQWSASKSTHQWRIYVDGEIVGYAESGSSITEGVLCIGCNNYAGGFPAYEFAGYISNFRMCKRVLYKENFTPSKFKLKNVSGTILLCCQDASDDTAVTVGDTLTAGGSPTPGGFGPDLKEDITDIGPTFADNTKFDTLSYMVPPGGTTTQRGRGRGVMGGFYKGPNTYYSNIEYLSIQSLGNTTKFGDLTLARTEIAACSSSTRALFAGGTVPGGGTGGDKQNIIDYVTIATTANAINFGDLTDTIRTLGGCSNETRGIFAGGIDDPARLATIDYVTIATLGDGQDFGDLTEARRNVSAHSSTTRGIFAGGLNPGPAYVDTIDYITIATTGSIAAFGELTALVYATTSCSNSTRGVIMGGTNPSGATNVIDYVTIATTGDGTDFGDLTVARADGAGIGSPTRGLMIGGETPSNDYNTIDYVTIASTGNAVDFGDASVGESRGQAGSSDCHGGIS